LTCEKLKVNLIAVLQFTVHFKSASVYVMCEACAMLKLVFMIFIVRINKACPILSMGGNQIH